jgi:hypothetical protein
MCVCVCCVCVHVLRHGVQQLLRGARRVRLRVRVRVCVLGGGGGCCHTLCVSCAEWGAVRQAGRRDVPLSTRATSPRRACVAAAVRCTTPACAPLLRALTRLPRCLTPTLITRHTRHTRPHTATERHAQRGRQEGRAAATARAGQPGCRAGAAVWQHRWRRWRGGRYCSSNVVCVCVCVCVCVHARAGARGVIEVWVCECTCDRGQSRGVCWTLR